MSTVIQFPNASASKVIQPKRKGRYPSMVTKLRTAWLKRYDEKLASSRLHTQPTDDPFSEWSCAFLSSISTDGEPGAIEFLRLNPPMQEWAECLSNLLRNSGQPHKEK